MCVQYDRDRGKTNHYAHKIQIQKKCRIQKTGKETDHTCPRYRRNSADLEQLCCTTLHLGYNWYQMGSLVNILVMGSPFA